MTVMPHPGVSASFGPEVGLSVVVDLGGEAQQAAVGVGRRLVGGGGQAVLLVRALQHEHGPVLHVGGLLHHLRVQHQVGSRCGEKEDGEKTFIDSNRTSLSSAALRVCQVNKQFLFQAPEPSGDPPEPPQK